MLDIKEILSCIHGGVSVESIAHMYGVSVARVLEFGKAWGYSDWYKYSDGSLDHRKQIARKSEETLELQLLETLAYNISEYRQKKGISQQELANNLGVSRQFVNAIENCRQMPNVVKLFRIANLLDLQISDLFNVNH